MAEELIDRKQIFFTEKPESYVKGNEDYREGFLDGAMCVLNAVDTMPTIEAKPVVRAHWISEDEAEELGHLEWSYGCSNCKEIFWDCTESFAFSYCPHCGAQMDEVTE